MTNEEYTAEDEVEVDEVENNEDQDSQDEDSNEQEPQRQTESTDAKRARLQRQLKQLDKKFPVEQKEVVKVKSNSLDYGQKAFLVANGVKGESESKLVQDFMKETGKSLEQVLDSKYFQAELSEMRELGATSNATPTGKRSSSSTTDSVEYWSSKPIEDVPQDMRIKVINAQLAKENGKGVFYNS